MALALLDFPDEILVNIVLKLPWKSILVVQRVRIVKALDDKMRLSYIYTSFNAFRKDQPKILRIGPREQTHPIYD